MHPAFAASCRLRASASLTWDIPPHLADQAGHLALVPRHGDDITNAAATVVPGSLCNPTGGLRAVTNTGAPNNKGMWKVLWESNAGGRPAPGVLAAAAARDA